MPKFRKKPVVIEAQQFTIKTSKEVSKWCNGLLGDDPEEGGYFISISTLEGDMIASLDDYIIKGVRGEFYPCKPDIFEQTYELVDEDC